jgi:hypothetical protein
MPVRGAVGPRGLWFRGLEPGQRQVASIGHIARGYLRDQLGCRQP